MVQPTEPPLISVLIPCYNTARYLPQAIDSVLAQTFQNFEIILLNDGSTDHTESLLQELQARDPRVRAHSRENHGLIDTRNELLSLARGQFVAWHDSDDLMAPRRLEWQLAHLQQDPDLVWIGGACTLTDPDGLPIRSVAYPYDHDAICAGMREEFVCCFGTMTMRRDTISRVGGFRNPFSVCEDYDLCLRMSEVGRTANLREVVLLYRQHMASTCNSRRAKMNAYAQLARDLAAERQQRGTDRLQRGEPIELAFGTLPSSNQNLVETHRRWAWWALGSGHIKTARKYAFHAMRESPLESESWKLMACALRGR